MSYVRIPKCEESFSRKVFFSGFMDFSFMDFKCQQAILKLYYDKSEMLHDGFNEKAAELFALVNLRNHMNDNYYGLNHILNNEQCWGPMTNYLDWKLRPCTHNFVLTYLYRTDPQLWNSMCESYHKNND